MDGKQLIKPESRHSEESQHAPRNLILMSLQETGFIEYMDQGTWHLAFYNDGKKMEQVQVLTTAIGKTTWFCLPPLSNEGFHRLLSHFLYWTYMMIIIK